MRPAALIEPSSLTREYVAQKSDASQPAQKSDLPPTSTKKWWRLGRQDENFGRPEKRKKLHVSGGWRRSRKIEKTGAICTKKSNFASENHAYRHFSRVRDALNGNSVGKP
jgi:myosin-crossreactive antigen